MEIQTNDQAIIENPEHVQYFENQIKLQKQDFINQNNRIAEQSLEKYLQTVEQYNIPLENRTITQGPNINNLDTNYDFTNVQSFLEYNQPIHLHRLLGKSEISTCSYVGKIENQLCYVKLIPMVHEQHIKNWIRRVQKVQEDDNIHFQRYFRKYYYYQIQRLDLDICNIFIISSLDNWINIMFILSGIIIYYCSIDPKIILNDKVKIAFDIIQLIQLVFEKKIYQEVHQQVTYANKDIYKNISTIKRNNLLIAQSESGNFMVKLADWQLLLDEFQPIIPLQFIQKTDNNRIATDLESILNNTQLNQNIEVYNAKVFEFIKNIISLLFFKANYGIKDRINSTNKLNSFIKWQSLDEIMIQIKSIENQENLSREEKYKKIIDYVSSHSQLLLMYNNDDFLKIINILMQPDSESMREALDDWFKQDQ